MLKLCLTKMFPKVLSNDPFCELWPYFRMRLECENTIIRRNEGLMVLSQWNKARPHLIDILQMHDIHS